MVCSFAAAGKGLKAVNPQTPLGLGVKGLGFRVSGLGLCLGLGVSAQPESLNPKTAQILSPGQAFKTINIQPTTPCAKQTNSSKGHRSVTLNRLKQETISAQPCKHQYNPNKMCKPREASKGRHSVMSLVSRPPQRYPIEALNPKPEP